MSTNTPLLTLSQPCQLVVDRMVKHAGEAGLTVLRTFDLVFGQGAMTGCPCPVHGSDPCNCQVVVLLIYKETGTPVTLLAHGDEHETIFNLVDTPQQRPEIKVEGLIRECIAHLEVEFIN